MTSFIQTFQLPLLILFFLAGTACATVLFRRPDSTRAWRIADLVWVFLGGFGALTAVVAGIYRDDSSLLARQADLAYAASDVFDRDAGRFRLRYCSDAGDGPLLVLCEKVEFLSASTAGNSDLPLFITSTAKAAPLQGLTFLFGGIGSDMPEVMAHADNFDPAEFQAFDPRDMATRDALAQVRGSDPIIAADYQILANTYDGLIEQVGQLKAEWEYLQANAHILVLQIIALCLVSFAAPFRLGKSIADLKK